ncbi:unnamed protein product [Rhizoctonia solani]|uniref:Protein kinase domain-containing protein n=1 Tax=Rhizoctonia solani TaxID=456999 RepID=A0A8H2WJ11_9AGAM|nr:unnamed protein product [Rhizoctonia solani]
MPQPIRAASDFEQNLSDIVSSTMTSTQILSLLTTHGCVNITSSVDFSLCSNNPVATGGLGDVYVGRLRTGTHVAIKVLRSYGESNELAGKYQKAGSPAARLAIDILNMFREPHLIGLTVFRECLAMVSEWEDNGNMTHYLSRNPTVNRCELSKSICAGISYLHRMDIVHGDLKGANVLIDRNGAPRLTDFGSAKFQSDTLQFTQTNTGPSYSVRWTAPEILRGKTGHTKEGDIYALGMTILEAFTTEVPFSGRSEVSLFRHIVDRKKTPSRPGSIIPESSVLGNVLWALLMSCWSYNPTRRPVAQTVHEAASRAFS